MLEIKDKIRFSEVVNRKIRESITLVENFEFFWTKVEKKEKRNLLELKQLATVQSIGSSTRIEGSIMTDGEIASIIKDIAITKMESRDEQEVVGYFDLLNLVYESYDDINLSENSIKQLHGILLKHSAIDQRHKGDYKNLSNKVVANYADGTQKTVFKTTEPHLTAKEMMELIDWTNAELHSKELHPILIIAVFVYEFLSIHPFQDGNGRLSRLLTTLLLLRSKYTFIQYISFENHIEYNKDAYFGALMTGQKNRYTDAEMIEEWVLFFIGSMNQLVAKLQIKYASFEQKNSVYLNERQKKIVALIRRKQPLKISDISKSIVNAPLASVKKDLAYLVANGLIKKQGNLKASIYIM